MQEPLVSVIIPIYNVEQYLAYCMESVLAQTYKMLEIVLVDDGSTDKSGEMCDCYQKQDDRVRVIHKKNGGLSSARNAGIKIMTGEYVVFIDSDDYVSTSYVEILMDYAKKDQADLVISSYEKVIGNCAYEGIVKFDIHRTFNSDSLQYGMLARKIPMYACGKLYKAMLFNAVQFPEGKLYEDVPTSWEISKCIERATYINAKLYFYRQRPDSIVNAEFHCGRMEQLYAAERILEEVKGSERFSIIAASRCFFCAADNYALVTKDYCEEKLYLRDSLIKYRGAVLKDSTSGISLKVMAIATYISPVLVRLMGKGYKIYNQMLWRMKGSRKTAEIRTNC